MELGFLSMGDPLFLLGQDSLEENCAMCNWPKNDYGHIQLIYDLAAKKLH